MLILRRKKNESILIGDNIRITIIECAADGVRVAIDAPKQISILREELSEAEQSNKNVPVPVQKTDRFITGCRLMRQPFLLLFDKNTKQKPKPSDSPEYRQQNRQLFYKRIDRTHIMVIREYPAKLFPELL